MGRALTSLVLLALAPETLDLLKRGLSGRVDADTTTLRLVAPPLSTTIEAIRHELGPVPLGVAARTATEAIEAIEHGADEAMVLDEHDAASVHALVDRTRVRGRLRADDANTKVNVAQADKLAALGTLVAGVAHEINNPLAALTLGLDLFPTQLTAAADTIAELARARADGRGLGANEVRHIASLASAFGTRAELDAQLGDLRHTAETIKAIVKDLLVFASPQDAGIPQVVDIPAVIEPVLRLVGRELASNAFVERDFAVDIPPVVASTARLTQVLTNVLVNATHALRDVPRDVHHVRISVRADADAVAISVSDSGPGIPPGAIERIFDPFYTTKRLHHGTGLGLSISRNLMRRMGGDLLVESVYGEGATFIMILPRPSEAELRAAYVRSRTVPRTVISSHRPSVMVVDDQTPLVRAYSRVLGPRFDLLLASDSQEAIEMLASGSHADVVLADLGLSPLDGAHLFRWLDQNRPDLAGRMVFVASEPELPRHRQLLSNLPNVVLPKPTPAATLIEAIEDAARR